MGVHSNSCFGSFADFGFVDRKPTDPIKDEQFYPSERSKVWHDVEVDGLEVKKLEDFLHKRQQRSVGYEFRKPPNITEDEKGLSLT